MRNRRLCTRAENRIRYESILKMHAEGETYAAIGGIWKIGKKRVRELIRKAKKHPSLLKPHWTDELSNKVSNRIQFYEIKNRNELIAAIKDKSILIEKYYAGSRKFSQRDIEEICTWLNMEVLQIISPYSQQGIKNAITYLEKHGYIVLNPKGE